MAVTDITFTGLYNLHGRTVSCCIAGLDCGDYTVDGFGQITVPIDAHPSLSAAYLAQIDALDLDTPNACGITIGDDTYVVPVTIGLPYTTQGQALRPMEAIDIRSQTGGALGKVMRGYQFAMLLSRGNMGQGDGALSAGTDFLTTYPVRLLQSDRNTLWADAASYEGAHWDVLNDQSGFDTMFCWQVSRPVALVVDAIAVHLHSEDR